MTPTTPTDLLQNLRLNITGSLPGEAAFCKVIDLKIELYRHASPEVQTKIADDIGNWLDRLFQVNEKLLDHLHFPKL